MYRKKSTIDSDEFANLDSLMDILTCVVGVMLFVVIFAVMEARGVNVKVFTPLVREPESESVRKIFLCSEGRIRQFGFDLAIKELFSGPLKLTFDNVPQIVNLANQKNVSDDFFSYSLNYEEWTEESLLRSRRRRKIVATVKETPGASGERVEEIQEGISAFRKALGEMDSNSNWIAFMVDKESLDVFRLARETALSQGFSVGWDPGKLSFPYNEVIIGGNRSKKSKYTPKRRLDTLQN